MEITERLHLYIQLTRLHRPIGILLLLWPTLWAVWIAAEGHPSWLIVLIFTLGTVLMRSSGCAVNDYADRHFDKHVKTHTGPSAYQRQDQRARSTVGRHRAGDDLFRTHPAAESAHLGNVLPRPVPRRQLSVYQSASSPSPRPTSASPLASAFPWPSPQR